MPDPRQKLYNALSSKFDLGTFDEFNSKMDNPESRKKLYSSVSSNFDLGSYDEFESKIGGVKKKDGTKSNSTSTSVSPKQVSEQTDGSSGSLKQPEYEYKPIKDERGREVYEKDASGNLVPKKEKVLKGYASLTEEREIVREEVKQKALKPIKTSVNLQKYQEATKPTEQEINDAVTEIDDKINQKGFGNGFATGLKKGANFLSDVFTTIGTFGTETKGPNFDLNPYAKEEVQAKKELTEEFKGDTSKFSNKDVVAKTKQIVLDKKIEGLKIDKNQDFLSNLPENDKRALELESIANYKTISAKDKYLATEASILINETEKNAKDYNVVKAIVLKNNQEGKQTPKELLDYGIELENKLKNSVTEATQLENKISENTNDIGSTEEEIDFLKRNYSMKDKFITNVKLGFGDIYMNLGVKQELAIGDAFGVIDEERKQEIIDQSIDWENAKQIYKNKESRDISFENLGVNNFGEFFFQELGTQVSIFAQIAMPGGVTSIGLTSAFDKYSQMEMESNQITFLNNGKQYSGYEKENGKIVSSDGFEFDRNDVTINSLQKADYNKAQMISTAIGFGAAEAVLGAMPTKGILSRSVRSFEQAGQRQLLRESGKQYLKRKGVGIIESGSMESVTEGLTQVTQNLLDKSVLGKTEVGLFDNVSHAAFSGGMLGGAMTMMPTVAGLMMKPFSENKQSKEVNENLQMIFNLQEQLNNSSIEGTSRQVIQDKISALETRNKEVLTSIANKTKGISEEVFNAIVDVNKKQEILRIQATEINADPNLDKKLKDQLISDLESQFNTLESKRSTLVSDKVTVLDALSETESNKLKQQAATELTKQSKSEGKTDEKINFTEEEVNKKAIEIYNQSKPNAVQQEATTTEAKQEAQPQAEVQETEQEVLETPTAENINNAIKEVQSAKSVKYWMEPEFEAETNKYDEKGEPNSFVKISNTESNDIIAYDENGNIVGSLSISNQGEEKGAFKIVVREDAQKKGWGKKILNEAERQGIDIIGNLSNNSFSASGRTLLTNWLKEKQNETAPSQVDNVDGNIQPGNNVVEPRGTTEQENNQASNVQPTDNSRNVEVKREIKIADKGQSYTVEKVDGDIVITDKKGKAPSKATERKILDEYSKTINFTQGTRVDDSFESSAETYIEDVATKSQNPSEIAEAISYVQNADMNENNVDPVQVAIAEALGEKSVEKSSFTNINDRNNITQSIALQYFAQKGKGKGLDQIAMEVEYEVFGDYNANNPRITEEDVANFIVDNPRGAVDFLNRTKNEALDKLKTAFTSVTGLPAKPQFIETAINQNTAFKNEIFNGNSLYLYSDEDLLSLQNQREEFEKSIEDGNQSENKQTTNEIAEGINNQPDNKYGKQTPGVQEDSGSKNSRKSNESGSGSKSSMVEGRAGNEAIYRTTEASNSGGSTSTILSIEEREELEARGINPDWDKSKFNQTLRENAKKNGVWFDYSYLDDKKQQHDHKKDNTTENDVYLNSDGKTLTKLNNLAFVLNGEHSTNLNAFMDRIQAHNELFPHIAYTIKGFMDNKLGNVSIVLEQPFVENASNASQSKINDYLQQNGFELSGTRDWSNANKVWTNGVYEIYDARPANVLKSEDGKLYFIDVVPHSIAYLNSKPEVTTEEKSKIDAFKKWLDDTDKRLKDFGDETLGINIPIVVARGAVKAMKAAVSTAQTVQEIIQAGLDFVKQSEWYQNLSKKEQNDVDVNFQDYINKPFRGTETKKSRLKIEEEIQERLDNNESEQDIIDSISDRREKMIAQDYIERQKNLSVPEVRKKVAESFEKADEALQDKKTTTEKIDKAFRNFIARFFDRQFVPKFILNKAGGRLVRNYLIASKGATGYAKQMYDEAYAKIYKGLTSAEIKTLDKMIQLRRFIAIDKNRAENNMPDVVHPDFINRQDAEIELAELEKELGVEKFKDLNKRADNYFNEFRGLLTEMQKSGLISKESLDMFFEIDYQPRMFLEFLQNNETDFVPETSSNTSLSADQIKKLEEGLNTSLIYDSQYLLSRSMNIRAKAIAMNNTNKKLVEFMEKQAKVVDDLRNKKDKTQKEKDTIKYFDELSKRVKINPIIGFTDTGSPKYKYALPKGFKNAYYYIDGVKHSIMMEEALHEQYFDSAKGFLNGNTKEVVAMASGTAVVKALATGNNPTFFITNTPRDFFFIATFSEEYGMSVLVNMAKLAKDATLGIRDIQKGNGNFKNFVKYGGIMDFLKDQGKLKHTEIQKLFNKVDNKKREGVSTVLNFVTASKLQMYSEIGFRMAVFNRSVKNQLKELGYTKIEDVKEQSQVDDIYTNAVASARGIMDFNQGGKITKDADAFIPYLNAATQGTRVMFDNFRERPFETTFRTAQTAGVFSGAVIGLSIAAFSAFGDDDDEMTPTERYLYAKKGVSKYDQTNYFIIFTGQKTESGQYSYIRIAKPQQITPFFSMTDGIMTSFIKAKIGDESPTDAIDNVMFAFEKNISPLEFSVTGNIARNPALKSALSYSTGYDFYRGEDLSYLRGKVPVPAEGFESKTVEDFYKKIGEESGMSPVRFKAAVESFITTPSTSPYVGFLYGGLDAMASDKDGKEVMSKLGKDLLKSTFNRVRKETTDFNRRLENDKALKKKIEQVEIENLKTKSLFKKYADAYTNKEMSVAEISKELEKVAQDNPFEAKRLKKMIKDKIKNKDVSPYVFEIKYAKSAESKALMLIDLFGDDLKDMSKLEPEEKKLLFQMKKMGAINKEVLFEYNRIITE